MSVDTWHFSTVLTLVVLASVLIYRCPVTLWLKIPWAYFLIYAITLGSLQTMGVTNAYQLGVRANALKIACLLILLPLFYANFDRSTAKQRLSNFVLTSMMVILTLDAIYLLFGGWGIFQGDTQDALVLAIFVPLFLKRKYLRFAFPVWIAAILYVKGLASYIVLALQLVILGTIFKKYLLYLPIAYIAYVIHHDSALSGKRWSVVWGEHLNWWAQNANPWIGTGPGSFEWISTLGPFVQRRMWLHSDWLQFLFEYGLFGLILSLVVYSFVGVQLWKRGAARMFSVWICLGVGMLVYSPMQFLPIQVLAGFFVVIALNTRKPNEKWYF